MKKRFEITILFILSILCQASVVCALETISARHIFDLVIKEGAGLKQPSDVAVGKDGRIFVMDGVNNRVAVFSSSGEFLYDFGGGGSGKGEFHFPLGITTDKSGRVYVADSGNHRVQALTSKGDYLYQIDLPKSGAQKPPDPTDVVLTMDQAHLIIVDNENHRLLRYHLAERRFDLSVGGMEIRDGFRWPFTVAIDRKGYQYVVDVINAIVRVVTPEGRITIEIGKWGVDKGEFFRPKGVTLDSKERIYVSDSYLGVIQAFDKEGKFLFAVGDENGKLRKFITPVRIYIDEDDRLYVTEMFANKVSVYKLSGPGGK